MGERERHIQLNVEFQRTARRDKKTFLTEQCKEMRKTIEWERLEISSRKLEISCKNGHNEGQKQQGPKRSRSYQEEVARAHRAILQTKLVEVMEFQLSYFKS